MNPILILLAVTFAVFLWLFLSFTFPSIGSWVEDALFTLKHFTKDDDKKESEEDNEG